jgi:hypothetical protein
VTVPSLPPRLIPGRVGSGARDLALAAAAVLQAKDFSNLAHAEAIHFAAVAPLRGALDRLCFALASTSSLRSGLTTQSVQVLRNRRSSRPESVFKWSGISVQVPSERLSSRFGISVQVLPEYAGTGRFSSWTS